MEERFGELVGCLHEYKEAEVIVQRFAELPGSDFSAQIEQHKRAGIEIQLLEAKLYAAKLKAAKCAMDILETALKGWSEEQISVATGYGEQE